MTENQMADTPLCKVNGRLGPNTLCGAVIVGGKYCGSSKPCVHKEAVMAATPPKQSGASELDAKSLRTEAHDVVCDRRDLFDVLRAAWRNGQEHNGEMDERERWELATQYATQAIQGWVTLRPVPGAAQPVAPAVSEAELYQLREQNLHLGALYDAVKNFIRVKGRHNTEVAYRRLVSAFEVARDDPPTTTTSADGLIPASDLSTCRHCGFRVKLNEPPQPGGPEGFGMRNAINGACTLCFGTGIDVAGEPCPFACNKGGAL
jgi:hypothetical protein